MIRPSFNQVFTKPSVSCARLLPVLYTRHRAAPDAPIIRVRLAHVHDHAAVADLLARVAEVPDAVLHARRLLRYDPRTHLTLCATTWQGGHEVVAGIASIAVDGDGRPDELLGDTDVLGVTDALHEACRAHVPTALRATA